jgi:hypothetical protein
MGEEPVERFRPTSGRITGVLALLLVAAVVVSALADPDSGLPLPVVAASLVMGVLVWSAMLRPRVWVTGEHLVLRNMLHTAEIPLAAIEKVAVQQVLAVSAGEKRYVSPAVGKSWRSTVGANRSDAERSAAGRRGAAETSYPEFVEERIARLAEEARARRGIALLSDEQLAVAAGVRRARAWPEIAALVLSGLFFLLSVAL